MRLLLDILENSPKDAAILRRWAGYMTLPLFGTAVGCHGVRRASTLKARRPSQGRLEQMSHNGDAQDFCIVRSHDRRVSGQFRNSAAQFL